MHVIEDRVVFLSEYYQYLGESFSPVETNYGTNPAKFNNSVIFNIDELEKEVKKYNHRLTVKKDYSQIYVTFFKYENRYYEVSVFKNIKENSNCFEIGFSTSLKPTINHMNYKDSIFSGTKNSLGVVNRVFYIFGQILKNTPGIDCIKFTTETDRESLYQRIIENKFFINMMKEVGFVFKEKQLKYWIFERIQRA